MPEQSTTATPTTTVGATPGTAFYDHYDYSVFWQGRDYEHRADEIALVAMLKLAHDGPHHQVIDVGGGLGRMIPYYAPRYERAVLFEPSSEQLDRTKAAIGAHYPTVSFVQGVAENMPFANASTDMIVCIRVSHHLPDMPACIKEFNRVLAPGGYVILEVANKLNMKSRIRGLLHGNVRTITSPDFIDRRKTKTDHGIAFINHNPKTIRTLLESSGFEIKSLRSVSNIRSAFLKNIIPLSWMVVVERLLQVPAAPLWFGPSMYFLAQKKTV